MNKNGSSQSTSNSQKQANTKVSDRKASLGNPTGSNVLGQIEKDQSNRNLGVRGSVELKSMNSMGGLTSNGHAGLNGNGLNTTQANSNGGFTWG